MSLLFDYLFEFLSNMLEFLGFTKKTAVQNGLGVYVKSNTGSTIYVELDRGWDIKNIKQRVAPQLGLKVDEVKIIFAGKELLDNVTINVGIGSS